MKKRCMSKALIVLAFAAYLCVSGRYGLGINGEQVYALDTEMDFKAGSVTEESAVTQMTENQLNRNDLTEAFHVILDGATKEFIADYAIEESFLMWLNARYGEEIIIDTAYCVLDGDMSEEFWYERTGNSMHVLWLLFCQDSGFQNERLERVYWQETETDSEVVISFTGDFNFAEDWCTTEYMKVQPNGIEDCFSAELLEQMRASDILIMNNEFTYVEEHRADALVGKAYTFRAEPKMVELLSVFGADAVNLANNHVYDYGKTGLLDTMQHLKDAKIPYVGAGADMDEASEILYYVANGRKIAIVSATQIERTTQYTREATRTEAGVLKTLKPEKFMQVIAEADAHSDYVIAVAHWGTEGTLYPEASQRILAERFIEAGADAIIGGHPHRLQGIGYLQGVPIAYSIGNFWFSDGTLYTTLAQVIISEDGSLGMRFLPCEQKNMVTSLLTAQEEKDEFYHYLAAISMNIGLDAEGNAYDKEAEDYPADRIAYDSETSTTQIRGMLDNEGNAIDIVGNRK